MQVTRIHFCGTPVTWTLLVSVSVMTVRRCAPLITRRLAVLQLHGVHPAASSVAVCSSQLLVLPWVGREVSTFPVISLLWLVCMTSIVSALRNDLLGYLVHRYDSFFKNFSCQHYPCFCFVSFHVAWPGILYCLISRVWALFFFSAFPQYTFVHYFQLCWIALFEVFLWYLAAWVLFCKVFPFFSRWSPPASVDR